MAPVPSSEPALHRPNCWYNLTGLPGDRCPECGETISRAAIDALGIDFHDAVAPLSVRRLVRNLLIVPAFCCLACLILLGLAAVLESVLGPEAVIVAGFLGLMVAAASFFVALGFAFACGGAVAARLAFRAGKPLSGVYYGARFCLVAILFFAVQVAANIVVLLVMAIVTTALLAPDLLR